MCRNALISHVNTHLSCTSWWSPWFPDKRQTLEVSYEGQMMGEWTLDHPAEESVTHTYTYKSLNICEIDSTATSEAIFQAPCSRSSIWGRAAPRPALVWRCDLLNPPVRSAVNTAPETLSEEPSYYPCTRQRQNTRHSLRQTERRFNHTQAGTDTK